MEKRRIYIKLLLAMVLFGLYLCLLRNPEIRKMALHATFGAMYSVAIFAGLIPKLNADYAKGNISKAYYSGIKVGVSILGIVIALTTVLLFISISIINCSV